MADEQRRVWLGQARDDLAAVLALLDREGELVPAAKLAEVIDVIERELEREC